MADYKKQVKQLISDLRELGFEVAMNGGSHWQVVKDGTPAGLVIPSTPSDSRWYLNTVRDMKRVGLVDRDPRELVREKKRTKRGGKMSTAVKLDEGLLNRRMAVRDSILKVVDTRGSQARLAEAMVESRPEGGVPTTLDGARMMLKRILQGDGSEHALDAAVRGIHALDQQEADRNPLACPDCDFVAAHARGLGRHRTTKHGAKSLRDLRREQGKFACPVCDDIFPTSPGRTTHMERSHGLWDKGQREALLNPPIVEERVEIAEPLVDRIGPTLAEVIDIREEEPEIGVEVVADEGYTPPQHKPEKILDVSTSGLLVQLALLIDPAYREEALVLLEQLTDHL